MEGDSPEKGKVVGDGEWWWCTEARLGCGDLLSAKRNEEREIKLRLGGGFTVAKMEAP